jgi:hypothetical protein
MELLRHPNLHEIASRAQALREERFGARTSVAFIAHRRLPEAPDWCAICGAAAAALEADDLTVAGRCSDLHVLVPAGATAAALLEAIPAAGEVPFRTAQVGVASDWMAASEGGDHELLSAAKRRGLSVLSDGVLPRVHPARGPVAARRWQSFWRAAKELGFVGHASLLQAPNADVTALLDQIEILAQLQGEIGVFASVAPVVDPPERFGGVQDGLLSHGLEDLRVLAACRLGLAQIEHVRLLYNRSDLKLAHVSLAHGADDLEGHLVLHARSPREDANQNDLSSLEMRRWLREAGYEPQLRNGRFEIREYPPDPSSEVLA